MQTSKQKRTRNASIKQNYRLWYNYLQIAIEVYPNRINQKFYKEWDINLIRRGLKFDSWYKNHQHLFIDKKKISISIPSTLSYKDAVDKAKDLLRGKQVRKLNLIFLVNDFDILKLMTT